MIYALSLLTLFVRIQLNLLGRRSYLSSVISMAAPRRDDSAISLEDHDHGRGIGFTDEDYETHRRYLAFSWWLLHRGWRDMMQKVESAVKEVFGPLNPREDITFERMSRLVLDVRMKVEGSTKEERRYVFPLHPSQPHPLSTTD